MTLHRDPDRLDRWRRDAARRWRNRRARSAFARAEYATNSAARARAAGLRCEADGLHHPACPGGGGRAAGMVTHHVQPRSKFGSDDVDNLRWVWGGHNGAGWAGCHGMIHNHPDEARRLGLLT